MKLLTNLQSRFPNSGSLRFKLLLIALGTLALPVLGWAYLRQMDDVLRRSQEQALLASARVLAQTLGNAVNLPAGPAWHVQQAVQPIVIDGYGDDWAEMTPWSQAFAGRGRLLIAADGAWAYFYAQVADTTRDRSPVGNDRAADHLELALQTGAGICRYTLAAAAPGSVAAMPRAGSASTCPRPLSAQWQEDGSGYRVEWRLPSAPLLTALGLRAYDASAPAVAAVDLRPVLRYAPSVARQLAQLVPGGTRARLLDAGAWVVADSGATMPASGSTEPDWLSTLLYRSLVAHGLDGSLALDRDAPRLDAGEVWQALSGVPATSWRSALVRGGVTLAAAEPLPADLGEPRGVLLLEQSSRTMPFLANRALLWLLLVGFGLLLAAGAALFAFAIHLGLRLGHLRNAVERAVSRDGQLRMVPLLPSLEDKDEIGDLARGFAGLLDAVRGHTDYLRTLASKLSHELNTPLAIVKSSLDNLDQEGLSGQAQLYTERARDGAERLGLLLRSMGAASRVERAVAAAEPEDFDLRTLVAGCADGYRLLADERRFELQLPPLPLTLHGAPELVAQALDKLFDNALSFTPAEGWMHLSLRALDDGAEIELANQGPPLPPDLGGRLFDSLVSAREGTDAGGTPHLGLGLYIVRLIAELHGGRADARNIEDGVAFSLTLRGMPRPRPGAVTG
jgi:signal transduction histidine kinase